MSILSLSAVPRGLELGNPELEITEVSNQWGGGTCPGG